MKNVTMISFDTSTTDTGYAIFLNGELVTFGHMDFSNISDTRIRCNDMLDAIKKLIIDMKPQIVVCEGLNVFNNIKTDTELTDLIGACRGYARIIKDCWFDKLSAHEWRGLIADEGEKIPIKREKCKPWDIEKAKKIFGIDTDNDNIADAILIGEAYRRLFNE